MTSSQYPPVLLEPEEWIFGQDATAVLKELMQFDTQKMSVVKAPFNPAKTAILRPRDLTPWKINHFPEEWDAVSCELFVPQGHLTRTVTDTLDDLGKGADPKDVEAAFFRLLVGHMENLGYVFFKPSGKSEGKPKSAFIEDYLKEWEEDEQDAGLL